MSGLPREVLKWIQSLDLTWQIKTPKWDLTNGYLVAEIFSWYFPQDIQMHSYNNGTSLDSKLRNWSLLKLFIKRHNLDIAEELLEGTIHCKEGASTLLTERIYEILTNRKVRKQTKDDEIDFTDRAYQNRLPMHARSTASKAVKNNLRITETMADQNLILSAQKSQKIINDHIEHRRQERYENPVRFNVKPTLGERSLRRPPVQPKQLTYETDRTLDSIGKDGPHPELPAYSREPSVQFKEIQVNQLDKSALYNMPVQGF
ncbi:spermatogenesis-associated protein 4-like [Pecten maximus]|uniref:spermatogenesis-associated protein 4-like n=1 Tax=Pecten maximus TaxID=6579 RepID=UPI00145907A5|nr:spermatogenesis-associated protein 4-like [Pecten maximus]